MRHLIRVMSRHDLTNKKTMTNTNTKTKTMTKTNTLESTFKEQSQRFVTFETFDNNNGET